MIYLDNGATSFYKPAVVGEAVAKALRTCANPGRGGYPAAMEAARQVYRCRERAAKLFDCQPEQVVFTASCTQGLNMAIKTLLKPGERAVISGFEHNAVTRALHSMQVQVTVAGRQLFSPENTLEEFEKALRTGPKAAVFTHISNVFGYILPVEELAALCRHYGVPFVIDAAQSAGVLPVSLRELGADFIAIPGHKGLLGPQGTGILLCNRMPKPLICGGTGSESVSQSMPDYLPDGAEAGTANVPGIAGLWAGMGCVMSRGLENIHRREREQAQKCARAMDKMGLRVFYGKEQAGTVSFVPQMDCELLAERLARRNIAVRAGLHCAPLAHESAGTLATGTVRVSFGHDASAAQSAALLRALREICSK